MCVTDLTDDILDPIESRKSVVKDCGKGLAISTGEEFDTLDIAVPSLFGSGVKSPLLSTVL